MMNDIILGIMICSGLIIGSYLLRILIGMMWKLIEKIKEGGVDGY